MKKIIFSILCFLGLTLIVCAQRIEYVEVQGNGIGKNDSKAVEDAIIQCVSQVNGLSIETQSQLNAVEYISDDTSVSSELFQRRVASATRGVVSSYKIISTKKNDDGLIEAVVSAKIAKYQKGKGADRLRIAVLPFYTSKSDFSVAGESVHSGEVSRLATQSFVNRMVDTRKFTVLDREYATSILQEKATIAKADTPMEEMCKFGQVLGADYIVVGIVESVSSQNKKVKMEMSGLKATVNDSGCAITLRFIDIATRQIKFSGIVNSKVKLDSNSQSPLLDIFNQFSEQAIKKVMDNIYPLRVIAVEDDEVVLNQGGDSIIEGDKYEMFAMGDVIKDPYTKESLGRKETKCGVIEIIRVKGKTSDGKILGDYEKIKKIFGEKEIVCRLMKEKAASKKQEKLSEKKDVIW